MTHQLLVQNSLFSRCFFQALFLIEEALHELLLLVAIRQDSLTAWAMSDSIGM